ncbi:MAG: hypothetical protein JWN40_5089 [Phycisphaerales bacterium]|nr:hypothetical protein [Phycisphaerales bacterium]
MSLVPDTNEGKILFFQSKNTPWAANSTAIGTTTGAVTALATKVTSAQTKLAAAIAAREASKNATADLKAAVRDMATAGSDIIKQIRAKAATDGNGVYILAQIPAPATPTPVPAPGTPTGFSATLNPDGSLKLKWKCANPAGAGGTMYQVSRRTGSIGAFASIGGTGNRSFIDAGVPAGVASVTYQIVAVRSTAVGVAAQFIVNFGVAGGEMVASVVQSQPKLAA